MAQTGQKDFYEVLGVKRNAPADQIRKAYRRLARKYHPDVNPGDRAAEERFKDIQEAYQVLNDPKKRQMYDQHGFYSDSAAYPGAEAGPQPGGFGFSGFDFSDFARDAGGHGSKAPRGAQWGNFSDLFSDFFRPGGRTAPVETKPGEDLEYSVEIGFWDAIKGTTVRLNIFRQETCQQCRGQGNLGAGPVVCPECKGSGQVAQTVGAMKFNLTCPRCQGKGHLKNACPSCAGEGRQGRNETVEVRIPPGAQSGSRLRVAGRGNAGPMGGPGGDLYIVTRVAPHPLFERKGDDIHIRVPITIPEAVLGAKIEVPTIDGKALFKIPPATSSDKVFRLRERGVMNRRTNRRGDQYVAVKVVVPEVPDEASKGLMREFARVNSEDPRSALWTQV